MFSLYGVVKLFVMLGITRVDMFIYQHFCPCVNTYDYNLTIIFSKRARISFSDVILEESSSNSEGVDQSPEEECLVMWERCGRSFLLPGIRILENLSN